MPDGAKVTGLRETVRNLEKLGVSVADLKEAFTEISEGVVIKARQIVKVATGALQATIRPARSKNKAVVRAGNTGSVPYGPVINYGRNGLGGDEFLTGPANEDPEGKAARIEANLQALIRKNDLN